jgi:mono/diheme cytochrome c family protein
VILLLAACLLRADDPVPAHGPHDAVRAAVVDEDAAALEKALQPFLASSAGVRGQPGMDWAALAREARALGAAEKRSGRTRAYGRFVASCAACHAGEPASTAPVEGHGPALVALDEAVIHQDPARGRMAVAALGTAPGLPGNVKRFTQLAGRIAGAEQVPEAAHFLGILYGECIRCHGGASPVRLTR